MSFSLRSIAFAYHARHSFTSGSSSPVVVVGDPGSAVFFAGSGLLVSSGFFVSSGFVVPAGLAVGSAVFSPRWTALAVREWYVFSGRSTFAAAVLYAPATRLIATAPLASVANLNSCENISSIPFQRNPV